MALYEIVPATAEHALELSQTMRQADRDEVRAQSGQHPAIGLGVSLGGSEAAWAGLVDGKVACIFGVGCNDEFDRSIGVPWLLSSDLIVDHQRTFLRNCRPIVDVMNALFPVLENVVDVRNTIAIRWLKWLKFDIVDTKPFGPFNMPFHSFRRVSF